MPKAASSPLPITTARIRRRLKLAVDPASAAILQRFFKTGPGEYGEGDVFLGVRLPAMRAICRECRGAGLDVIEPMLRSRIHEERLVALLLLVDAFQRGEIADRRAIYQFYLAHTAWINNWDLVDTSAGQIVGGWLHGRSRAPLDRLARSASLWERRIAIIATFHFIRRGEFEDTFRIADILLDDPHDLIHKAVGWMLREVGNRNPEGARRYLAGRYGRMPRTMLRYAIEKFPEKERQDYLKGRVMATRSAGASANSSSPRKSSGAKRKPKP
jgi:3-methyladenine DNA glycosylase AlkD